MALKIVVLETQKGLGHVSFESILDFTTDSEVILFSNLNKDIRDYINYVRFQNWEEIKILDKSMESIEVRHIFVSTKNSNRERHLIVFDSDKFNNTVEQCLAQMLIVDKRRIIDGAFWKMMNITYGILSFVRTAKFGHNVTSLDVVGVTVPYISKYYIEDGIKHDYTIELNEFGEALVKITENTIPNAYIGISK